MPQALIESETRQHYVIAVAMAIVLAVSLTLAYAVSSRPPALPPLDAAGVWRWAELGPVNLALPSAWTRDGFAVDGLPMDPAYAYRDPERPSATLVLGRLDLPPDGDPRALLDDVYLAMLRHPDFPGSPTRGRAFTTTTPETASASFFVAVPDAEGNFHQYLLTLMRPRDAGASDLVAAFLYDTGPLSERARMQENEVLVRSLPRQVLWRRGGAGR